jgi:hypothetical protein
MSDKAIFIIQILLFVILVITLLRVSIKGVSTVDKVILTISSFGILAFDKIKFLIWLIAVAVIWLIKYSKKTKKDGLA